MVLGAAHDSVTQGLGQLVRQVVGGRASLTFFRVEKKGGCHLVSVGPPAGNGAVAAATAVAASAFALSGGYELRYWARLAWAFSTLGLASEEAYHQRLARLMQERQQQLQRPTPAAGAVAAAQRPSRLQQRGRGHTANTQDLLQRFPGVGSAVYLHLDLDSRRTLRLVCKQLRTTIDGDVNSLDFASSSSCDPDEVLQRLARTSLRPSKLEFCQGLQQQSSHLLNLLAAALSAHELVPVLHGVKHVQFWGPMPLSMALIYEGSLAASTQLTKLDGINWFPGLTQLTQLQHFHGDLSSDSLPLLATLPQLAELRLQSCPLQISSQLSRFLFQHLTALSVRHIHSRDLAALDCPQLQTLAVRQLQVDCAASLRACASGILQHCCAVWGLFTWKLQEVHSASVLLEALAPWQPRSGKKIEVLGLWHLPDVTREALEWLPVNIKTLQLGLLPPPNQLTAALSDACDALSGTAATQLPSLGAHELAVLVEGLSRCQLQGVDPRLFNALGHAAVPHVLAGAFSPGGLASLLAGFARARQRHAPLGNAAARVAALQAEAFTCPQLANLLWALSVIRVVDRQPVKRVAELLLQGPLAGTGLGAGVHACPPSAALQPLSAGPRSASITWVLLALAFARARYHHQLYGKLGEAVLQGLQGSHLMPRLQQASRAAPRHPSSSSSSVAATHSRSGHGTRSTSPLAGLPLSLPAPPPSPASPLPSNTLARGPPQPIPLPTPLAQLSSTCLVQLLWAFASHQHCQAALLRAAAPVLSARILQGQLSSRRVACVAWAYARLQQLEPRLLSAILRHSMAHAEQYELRYWARLAWALSTLGLASEEAYHQRLARLMQERQQQLQRPTPAAGSAAQQAAAAGQGAHSSPSSQAWRRARTQGWPGVNKNCVPARAALPSSAAFKMLSDMLQRYPGIGSSVYLRLDRNSRSAMRLVCKQLRAAINCAVSGLEMILSDRDDPDEVLQRLARASLRPSKLYLGICSKAITQLTLLAAALLAQELVPVLHGVQHLTLSSVLPLSTALVMSLTMPQLRSLDVYCEMDVAACRAWQRLPHLSSLTLVLTHSSGTAAATVPLKGLEHITSLKSLYLTFSHDMPSSQLSRFLFQHLTSLTVYSIHSRDLAALDCPQLQTLTLSELQVDCAASLRACASGILQHCNDIYNLLTYNHGNEFKAAAAGAGVRQLGPPPSASVLLEALAPWQPRSGKAIEKLGLWHLPDVTREALEWLPVNIKSLTFEECHLLPGALSSVATRLTQLTCLDLTSSPVALAELQLLAASPASPLPSNPLARGPPQPSPLPTPLAQLSSTCLVQLLWAFASHQHCQAALLRAAAPVLSARILQGQLSSRRVACVAWAYARLQQLEPLNAAGGTDTMAAQSGKAIEKLERQHLVVWTCDALERLPVNPSP
ncbi:hypothetical protein QJQ45_000258 [Haematococcus lacustris]|nr:hypothetical protein QJQ45_000258 [Haematococcus lacustris]